MVRDDLRALSIFVPQLAEASPDAGPAIVANAGMSLKNATGLVKSGFLVKECERRLRDGDDRPG